METNYSGPPALEPRETGRWDVRTSEFRVRLEVAFGFVDAA